MFTKNPARVLHAKQPTPLQDWHNFVNKIVEGSGEPGRHKVEPVGRACHKSATNSGGPAQQSMPIAAAVKSRSSRSDMLCFLASADSVTA